MIFFQRSPRTYPSLPNEEVEIQSPPAKPAQATSSLVATLLPFGFTLLGIGLSVAFLSGNNASFLLLSLPLTAGSAMLGMLNYFNERRRYRREIERREALYHQHLREVRHKLEDLAEQQRRAALEIHPAPQQCLVIAHRQHPDLARHLWERSSGLERPRDPDFLEVRVGVGALPSIFAVKGPPRPAQIGEADELYLQAARLAAEFRQVEGMPIALPLGKLGAVGFSGPRSLLLEHLRAVLVSLFTLHAPTEVKLVALLPAAELREWEWIRWLPHIWDEERKRRYIAITAEESRALLAALFPLIQRRALSSPSQGETYGQTYVFLFADPALYQVSNDTSVIGPLMHLALTRGPEIGAYAIFLHDRLDALPAGCGATVDLEKGQLRLIGPPTQEISFQADYLSLPQADAFARSLAPLRLKAITPQTDLPSRLSLLELLRISDVSQLPLASLWNARDSHQSLEVPLGIESGGGTVFINFQDTANRGDGSHAMIGGTTGTGKTRFLQTLILLLAAHHHPHDLNFILIDYKGGDLLQGLEELPHVVGTLANLEKASQQALLIERLFVCLEAELRRRRNLLGGRNINEYQRAHLQGRQPIPLPHLFVVIDEFAEMIRNSPDKAAMTKRLLSIGATGRSLGVHLVLATQDPSGVVNDELRNNINIRICLRMGSREASIAMLRRPDAFEYISSAQVGRAYLQVGNDDRFTLFQVAWGGDPYLPSGSAYGEIAEVSLDGKRRPIRASLPLKEHLTQMMALAHHIRQTAQQLGLQPLKSPLSPPLREVIYLDELRTAPPAWDGNGWNAPTSPEEWLAPLIGQIDDPANQAQDPLRLPLGREGHLALFGEPGSGKTTFIYTLVTSLALTHTPADLHLYLLDFSGQRLIPLKGFPHVGDVFLSDDLERIRRLFRFLKSELQERKTRFAHLGVSNLSDYRALSGEKLPAFVIILEDYAAFNKVCSNLAPDLDDDLASLVRDGGSYGLHFVLTLTAPTELKPRLANAISFTAAFHLTSGDYSMAVGPTGGMTPAAIPGRGLLRGPLEFQTALPVRGQNDAERALALKALTEAMNVSWQGARPRAFAPLPAILPLSHVLSFSSQVTEAPEAGLAAPLGLYYDDPDQIFRVSLNDGPYFIVAGPPQSGKTTLLQAWTLALANCCSPERLRLCLVDFRHQFLQFRSLPHLRMEDKTGAGTIAHITDGNAFTNFLAFITNFLQTRQHSLEEARREQGIHFDLRAWQRTQSALVLIIDDFDFLQSEVPQEALSLLDFNLKKWRDLGFYLIVAGHTNDLENAWGWIAQLRNQPVGFQLGSAAYNNIFKLNLPADSPSKVLAPGEAWYILRNRPTRIKFADPHSGAPGLQGWVQEIAKRSISPTNL